MVLFGFWICRSSAGQKADNVKVFDGLWYAYGVLNQARTMHVVWLSVFGLLLAGRKGRIYEDR